MVPNDILQRTFHISYGGQTGTAFTVDINDCQYLITAKHIIEGLAPHTMLSISRNDQWEDIPIGDVWYSPSGADIAMISLVDLLSPTHLLRIVGDGSQFYVSQQIYFLGFPYGMQSLAAEMGHLNGGFPVPFVKTGIVSSFAGRTGSQIIFCDGHNNPGFSGGPIVTVTNAQVTILAVVSGYRYNDDRILLNGHDTGLTYRANTGLIIGYGLDEVLQRGAASQTGAPLQSN